jgi:sugar/nucleoside kinase (ribokinase family)
VSHDLVVLGDCNPDVVLTGDVEPTFSEVEQLVDGATLTIGGSGAIVASGAARLGLDTALIAVVGADALGRYQLEALQARTVDVGRVIVDAERQTGLTVVLWNGRERAILTSPGTTNSLRTELVDRELLRAARHVHVSSYFLQRGLQRDLPALLRQLRAAGVTVSLDTNWDPSGGFDEGLADVLSTVDCFFPNEAEALRITRQDDVESAAAALAGIVPLAVVKLGQAGALAQTAHRSVRVAAPSVDVVDTTGAGDSFAAGFLLGYLNAWSLEQTLRFACACGSLSTRALGGVDAQPTLDEALAVAVIAP